MRRAFLTVLTVAALVGCNQKPESPAIPLDQLSAGGTAVSGEVLEHIAASPYSYVRIRTSKGEVWAAVSETQLEAGAQVAIENAMLMKNFESTSLGRTFDEIYFGSVASPGGTGGGNPHAATSATAVPFDVTVEKATGPNARTVAEAWAQASGDDGKAVTIRGKVVKVNEGVMGKNWIHLRDGSGDAAAGTNDLTVTSLDVAQVGETVTITGTLRTNKDFGVGYRYPVIVEDAKVVKR